MSSPLADLIQRGESGSKSYDNYNRGTYTDQNGKERIRGADRDMDFSTLTVGRLLDQQALPRRDENRLFAVGRYQVIPDTMSGAVAALGLRRDEPFTDAVQDRIFSDYLITDKRPAIRDYITGEPGATLHAAQLALSQEWASVAHPTTGRSYYDKPGGANHASITAQETQVALDQMRVSYQQALSDGKTPQQAWEHINAQPQRAVTSPSDHRASADDGVWVKGESGEKVRELQQQLSQLGYTGADGKPLAADALFGPNTLHAVRSFQNDHGLDVDGKAGPLTLEKLDGVIKEKTAGARGGDTVAGSLADGGHPEHARYAQSLEKLEGLEMQRQKSGLPALFDDRGQLESAAGQLAFESRVAGLSRVDAVVARMDGGGLFAVQGAAGDPAAQRAYVDMGQAKAHSVEHSTRQLEEFNQQFPPAAVVSAEGHAQSMGR